MDASEVKRRMFQDLESKLWKKLFETKDIAAETAKWFHTKAIHQRVFAELLKIEELASKDSTPLELPSNEDIEKLVEQVKEQIANKKEMKNPVVICCEVPFVVMMSDLEMTDFELYKSKIRSIRVSMDLECWRHWTSVRGAFWRHQDLYACAF
jgi:hypothetical protein